MGVGQMGSTHHHQVHLLPGHHLFRQLRAVQTPAGCHRHGGFTANTLGNRGHEAIASPRNLRLGNHEVDADVEQVQTGIAHATHLLDGFGQGDLVMPVKFDHAKACRERQVLGPDITHRFQGLQHEATAAVQIAAIGVGALVAVGRKEALRQVPMGEMQLQPLKASIEGPPGRPHEVGLHAGDVVQRHGLGHTWQPLAISERRRSDRRPGTWVALGNVVIPLPRRVGTGLAARVCDLYAWHRASSPDGRSDFGQAGHVGVVPQAQAGRGDAPLG